MTVRGAGVSGPVRVATYTRISTDETNQPYSLGAQADRLDAFVASQPDWRIVARYTDQASGKSLDRPALAAARQVATTGAFDLLPSGRWVGWPDTRNGPMSCRSLSSLGRGAGLWRARGRSVSDGRSVACYLGRTSSRPDQIIRGG